jgi:hypothetical protein
MTNQKYLERSGQYLSHSTNKHFARMDKHRQKKLSGDNKGWEGGMNSWYLE